MIRVGFVIAFDSGWLGGINYFRNLLTAVYALPDRKIEPVILTGMDMPAERFTGFPPVEVVRSRLFDRYSLPWISRTVGYRSFGRDHLMERLLLKHRIKVLSHSAQLGARTPIPTIGWIPDFQHRHIPEFFSSEELARREREFIEILSCSRVIVSSFDAQNDLSTFYPNYTQHSRVLQFVPDVNSQTICPTLDETKEKYSICAPYFHLPNQFWLHKNHLAVINALRILKEGGERMTVLVTGNNSGYRKSDHYQSLLAHVEKCGVTEEFRMIGVVPYSDLIALMRYSVALINPSFFEGWSSTVEESKALGKRIILSDIPVHREQAPARGVYFNPYKPEELAAAMKWQLDLWSADIDEERRVQSIAALPARRMTFARKYQDIVLELC